MSEITKCPICSEKVILYRTLYRWDLFAGECKCGKHIYQILFKCRCCGRYTLHESKGIKEQPSKDKYGGVSMQPVEKFSCTICGTTKGIFRGIKSSYERKMM